VSLTFCLTVLFSMATHHRSWQSKKTADLLDWTETPRLLKNGINTLHQFSNVICVKTKQPPRCSSWQWTNIVISLSKIRNRDWSYTRHVICRNNHCCPLHQHPGQHSCSWSTVPGSITGEHDAILGRWNIYSALHLLSSQALTSLSFRP